MNIIVILCVLLVTTLTARGSQKQPFDLFENYSAQIKQIIQENVSYNLQFNNCKTCITVFNLIEDVKLKQLKNQLKIVATDLCITFMDEDVCIGMIKDYYENFIDNFFAHYINSEHVCVFLKVCKDQRVDIDFEKWKKMVLSDKPENKITSTQSKKFKVLHITDLHTDLEYTEGALADCDQPFCCRPESGIPPEEETRQAKYWGSNASCDIPLRTVDALLADSKNKADIDMILWTGDNTSHDVWHQQVANQTLPQRKITELLDKYFPNVPKYPMFGNHESFPADQYDTSKKDLSRWLRIQSSDMWKHWLSPEALLSFNNYGYYSQYNKDTNVRVIAINTQTCDVLNFYLLANVTDPTGQIEFLRKELYKAEKNQEKVFIIGHIPPGDSSCSSQWALRYQVLIDRFEQTISGQFFGHSHNDQFYTIKSSQGENRSVGTIFIAPSGTSFCFQNPSYRIIAFENEKVDNYFQYRLDLEKANLNRITLPVWDLAYDFKSEYNLKDLSNQSIYEFAFSSLGQNMSYLQKYVSHYWTGSKVKTPQIIDSSVKVAYTCMAQNIIFDDKFQCYGIYAFTDYPVELAYKFLEMIQGPWQIMKQD